MQPFMSPSKTLVVAAVVSASLVPGCLAVLAFHALSSSRVSPECKSAIASEPLQVAPENVSQICEVSLQETLDRLGYTVNVPTVYGGHRLLRWNDYRLSTENDALPATNFHGLKSSRFIKVSEQGMLAGSLDFGVMDEQGSKHTLLKPDRNQNTFWIASEGGDSCSTSLIDATQFYINDTSHMLPTGPFFSLPQANADHAPHLLALPARTGGQWVDEGNNTGHWEGGKDMGATLLCWEDWQDFDYQDMVILAEDVMPDKGGAGSKGTNNDRRW